VPSPQPDDAEEARFAELYILWALSDFARFMWTKYDAQKHEWSRLHAADGIGRAQASSLLQRLLAEYWACPPDDRKHILQDTSALLYASASTADVYYYLVDVAGSGWYSEFDASFTGFHDLRMTYAEPRLQGALMFLTTCGCTDLRMFMSAPDEEVWQLGSTCTNRELLDLMSELEKRPAIYRYLRPEGGAPGPAWHRLDAYTVY